MPHWLRWSSIAALRVWPYAHIAVIIVILMLSSAAKDVFYANAEPPSEAEGEVAERLRDAREELDVMYFLQSVHITSWVGIQCVSIALLILCRRTCTFFDLLRVVLCLPTYSLSGCWFLSDRGYAMATALRVSGDVNRIDAPQDQPPDNDPVPDTPAPPNGD